MTLTALFGITFTTECFFIITAVKRKSKTFSRRNNHMGFLWKRESFFNGSVMCKRTTLFLSIILIMVIAAMVHYANYGLRAGECVCFLYNIHVSYEVNPYVRFLSFIRVHFHYRGTRSYFVNTFFHFSCQQTV